jgi:exonuclease VII large subunit
VVSDENGRPVTSARSVSADQGLELRFRDGRADVRVKGVQLDDAAGESRP